MRSSAYLLALAAIVDAALAAPALIHTLHEKRTHLPRGWQRVQKLDGNSRVPMSIALKQSNLEKLEEYLMEVAGPASAKFGQHWRADQIADTFAPSTETVQAVNEWLQTAGIHVDRIGTSDSMGWLKFDATVDEAEKLLKSKYHMYEHESGARQIGCEEYHVPESVSNHIDFITPTLHFDARVDRTRPRNEKRSDNSQAKSVSHSRIKEGTSYATVDDMYDELESCVDVITPDCLRTLYNIPEVYSNVQTNPIGIVEYYPDSYLQTDLDLFFSNFSTSQQQTTPTLNSIDGGNISTTSGGFDDQGESDLDLEYTMTLVNPIPVTLYQVGDSGSFTSFLEAIDASYCTYDGYDDTEGCGNFEATKVISISWGFNEWDLSDAYEQRQCAEYAKLGLAGTTVIYSSGDNGVGGNSAECIDPTTGEYNDGTSGMFNPDFPASCPYVTAVGATMISQEAGALNQSQPEVAANVQLSSLFSSGGGFSNVFGIPSYQQAAISDYYANNSISYTSSQYNDTQQARGFPDVSANGASYSIAIDSAFSLIYGTSAAAPTFASIIAIINEYRALEGKSSVGFVNPALYANPSVMNDVVEGNNPGCGTQGFKAAEGWDPVTGLGTPDVPAMLELFLSLP